MIDIDKAFYEAEIAYQLERFSDWLEGGEEELMEADSSEAIAELVEKIRAKRAELSRQAMGLSED